MNGQDVKLVDVASAVFPDEPHTRFVKYAQSCTKNPYTNMLDIRLEAAKEMFTALKADRINPDSKRILDYFRRVAENDKPPSAFLIHHFPSDPKDKLLETPRKLEYGFTPEHIGKDGTVAETAILAANTLSGYVPRITERQHGGMPFHHICVRDGRESIPSGTGASHFPWHTEEQWYPDSDMQLTLLCIKNKGTATFSISLEELLEHFERELTSAQMDMLEESRFRFFSGFYDGEDEYWRDGPILVRKDGQPAAICIDGNPDSMKVADPDDKDAQELVDKIIGILEGLKQGVILKPGQILFPDNLRNPHTGDIPGRDDLYYRHLIRTQTRRDPTLTDFLLSLEAA